MECVNGQSNEMRQRADWMRPADDTILELVREHGNLTPGAIEGLGGPVADYAGDRARTMVKYGLLHQVWRGLYGITDEGHAYLDEDLDASTLSPADLDE